LVAQLEIDAIEELTLFGMGRHKELPDLEAARQKSAAAIESERHVQATSLPR